MARILLGLVLALSVLVVVRRLGQDHPPIPAANDGQGTIGAAPAPPPPTAALEPALAAPALIPLTPAQPAGETPVIDLMARLETRRRLFGSSRYTYIDSMLVSADSTLRRWSDSDARRLRVAATVPIALAPTEPRLRRALETALEGWEQLGLGIRFDLVSDSSGADITVEWIDRFEGDRSGQADVQWRGDGTIQSARVTLAVRAQDERPLSDLELAIVATHEIGHALGLPHSSRPTDVMYPTARKNGLSRRDRATLTLLYSLPPGSVRSPETPLPPLPPG